MRRHTTNDKRQTTKGNSACLLFAICYLLSAIVPLRAVPLYRDSLPNGLEVYTYVDHRLPMTDISLVCRSGSAAEPNGKWGVANLTADLLTRGTKTMSADSVASITEFLGASFNGMGQNDQSGVGLQLLSKDLLTGLDLLADAIRNPGFDAREFERARAETRSNVRDEFDSPMDRVRREFYALMLAGHPYGHMTDGDTTSLNAMKREDVLDFYKTNYVPNNCFIVAVGDVDRAEFLKLIQARFGDWQPGKVFPQTAPEIAYPAKLRVKLITRPDMNQTYVMLGQPGIARGDSDWLATSLAAHILGGGALASRLGDAVREDSGLAYDVRCRFDDNVLRGTFWSTVQTARPKAAIPIILREIEKMQKTGAKQSELDDAENYFAGSYPIRYSTSWGKLGEVISIATNHLGLDWIERYQGKVHAVTLEQVNRAAREHIHPGQYLMVVMGNVTKEDLGLTDVEWIP